MSRVGANSYLFSQLAHTNPTPTTRIPQNHLKRSKAGYLLTPQNQQGDKSARITTAGDNVQLAEKH